MNITLVDESTFEQGLKVPDPQIRSQFPMHRKVNAET
jgi:hypothetical protein